MYYWLLFFVTLIITLFVIGYIFITSKELMTFSIRNKSGNIRAISVDDYQDIQPLNGPEFLDALRGVYQKVDIDRFADCSQAASSVDECQCLCSGIGLTGLIPKGVDINSMVSDCLGKCPYVVEPYHIVPSDSGL